MAVLNDIAAIERCAMRMAVGNNGGTWDTHYTEKQKDFWRGQAVAVITDCFEVIDARHKHNERVDQRQVS